MNFTSNVPVSHPLGFLSGGQELSELIRTFDWDSTPLGPITAWPQSLRTVLSICLNSNFPIAIYWGKEMHLLYNDAWSPIPGNKHPGALGQPAEKVWPDIWNEISPQFAKAFSGRPGGSKDALLPMQRHGYIEECYFDFTFTPIYGEAGTVEGVFNAVIETTYRVINERRTTLLKAMAVELAGALTVDEVYQRVIGFIKDFPAEECLREAEPASPLRERVELVYRNALRMQKLVNTLLEFSRLEAGRVEANYMPVDICTFTSGLAGTFRSAIEKAGM